MRCSWSAVGRKHHACVAAFADSPTGPETQTGAPTLSAMDTMMKKDVVMESWPYPPEEAERERRSKPGVIIGPVRICVSRVEPCDRERLHQIATGGHALRVSEIVALLEHCR